MFDEPSLTDLRHGFTFLRWLPLLGILGLPFTFPNGPIEPGDILGAWVLGTVITGSMLMRCRTRSDGLIAAAFLTIMLGSQVLGPDAKAPPSIIFQWGCFIAISAGVPLLLFKKQLLRFARLDEENSQAAQDQPN